MFTVILLFFIIARDDFYFKKIFLGYFLQFFISVFIKKYSF